MPQAGCLFPAAGSSRPTSPTSKTSPQKIAAGINYRAGICATQQVGTVGQPVDKELLNKHISTPF